MLSVDTKILIPQTKITHSAHYDVNLLGAISLGVMVHFLTLI